MTINVHVDKIEVSFPGFNETHLKTLKVYIMRANGEDLSVPLAALKDAVNANDAIVPDAPPVDVPPVA